MTEATATNINYNAQYCLHRLPCGYCQVLNRACPMYSATPIWTPDPNVVYCNAKDGAE